MNVYDQAGVTVHHGDALEVLATLPDASVDSVVTDPPYALGFMGQAWDTHTPGGFQHWCEMWAREALRVLKPGGHLVAFGGTRTYHRLASGIEDAGFEVRDSLHWITGQGFPKSLNVNKDARFCQCSKGELTHGLGGVRGVRQDVSDVRRMAETSEVPDLLAPVQRQGEGPRVGDARPQGCSGAEDVSSSPGSGQPCLEGRGDTQAAEGELRRPGLREMPAGVLVNGEVGRLHHGAPARDGAVDRAAVAEVGGCEPQGPQPPEQRPVESGAVPVERGPQAGRGWPLCGGCGKPSLPPGLGTALRPAHEPIVLARKPLAGTVAGNVLQHGTGALNVDGCRVATEDKLGGGANRAMTRETRADGWGRPWMDDDDARDKAAERSRVNTARAESLGRWPANVLLDGDAAEMLDAQSGILHTHPGTARRDYGAGMYGPKRKSGTVLSQGDSGGASRFFPVFRYQAKADTAERPVVVNGIKHPTVKPLDPIRWLVRLVTPPGGTVLDPFTGSGTTAEACLLERLHCIAIEREADYLPLIRQRLDRHRDPAAYLTGRGETEGTIFDQATA